MEYRVLGRTGLMVSALCLGTGFRGQSDERTMRSAIDAALAAGINFVDSANVYREGGSERIVGEALKGRRQDVVLTSKVGQRVQPGPNGQGLSASHIVQQAEQSLRRLQTDYVDLYFAHMPDPQTSIDVTLRAFDTLIRQGKVRYIGCSNYAVWQVCAALWRSDKLVLTPFMCVQDEYNLLNRSAETKLFPLLRSEGLGLMTYSPLAIGLLTGRFHQGVPPPAATSWGQGRPGFADAMSPQADRIVEELLRIGRARSKTPAQVAIAWVLSHQEVSAAILGPDTIEQVEENLGGCGWSLSPDERQRLDDLSASFVRTRAPV